MTSAPGNAAATRSSEVAPSNETTTPAPASSAAASSSFAGLTASTTTSARSAELRIGGNRLPADLAGKLRARPEPESVNSIRSTSPASHAPLPRPCFPDPTETDDHRRETTPAAGQMLPRQAS